MKAKLLFWLAIVSLSLTLAVASHAQTAGQEAAPASQETAAESAEEPPAVLPADVLPAPVEPAAAGTARQSAMAAREAATESARTVSRGASDLAAQPRQMWNQVLLPMWQRVANALPSLIKAILLLLFFWLAAWVLSALVRKLLQMTQLDDRAAKDWGLAGLLKKEGTKPRSIADLAGLVVKWTILLFGFVAFFQALDLQMVAEPLQSVGAAILAVVPNLLEALVILAAYWIVATLVRLALTKALTLAKFDERTAKYLGTGEVAGDEVAGKDSGPSATVGRLAFYLILLFGLAPFLEALGQTALVRPLTAMLEKTLAFLPNVAAALILFFIGKLVATIVREVVSNFLAASGVDGRAEKLGFGKALGARRLSGVVANVAYFFILIPVIVASVDSLKVTAISDPVKATLERLLTAVPLIFVALVIFAVGYAVARAVREVVETFLEGVGFDDYPQRFGVGFLAPKEGRTSLSSIAGTTVMAIILLLTAEQALATLHLYEVASMFGVLIGYLPNLLAALAIVLIALSLSGLAARLVGDALGATPQARIVVPFARYAIIFLGVSMGLTQLGVGEQVVMIAVAAVLFGAAMALGLAFGMGGREKARELIDQASQSS